MKKKLAIFMLGLTVMAVGIGCGKKASVSDDAVSGNETAPVETISWETISGTEETTEEVGEQAPEGMYKSELTGEWISEDLKDQRPIAVMVDNELTALNHFGTSRADIVYEMMNSTKNGSITRLMCIFKDYNSVSRIGSIRSIRPTNLQLIPEYDAIAIHDGGPELHINKYLANPFLDNISAVFMRINNGKPAEYTEYVTTERVPGVVYGHDNANKKTISEALEESKFSLTYRPEWYEGPHFKFAENDELVDISSAKNAQEVSHIDLPYEHNSTNLTYIPETRTYRYKEYDREYIDELTGDHMEFTNVILQEAKLIAYEPLKDGYMMFDMHNLDNRETHGYYLTGGYCIPITWQKGFQEYDITHFYMEDGTEITLNIGKTYICIIPIERWSNIIFE